MWFAGRPKPTGWWIIFFSVINTKSGIVAGIRLYFNIPEHFMHLIRRILICACTIDKYGQILISWKFPVDHICHLVMPSLLLPLCEFDLLLLSLLLLLLLLLLFTLWEFFHIGVNWWSFTGVGVTASLLTPPGLFSVFWPKLIRQ